MGIKTKNYKIVKGDAQLRQDDRKAEALALCDLHPVYNGVALSKLLGVSSMCIYKWMGDDAQFNEAITKKFKRNKEVCNKSWLEASDILWSSVFERAKKGCLKSTGYAVNISKTIKETLDDDFKQRQEIKHQHSGLEDLLKLVNKDS